MKMNSEFKKPLRIAATITVEEMNVFILNAEIEREEYVLENQPSRPLAEKSWQQLNQLIAAHAAPTRALQVLMNGKDTVDERYFPRLMCKTNGFS